MISLITILILLACVVLAFFILVQNPKGGGLTGALGGFSNQLIGVKQSTDVMEKGTWIFAAIVGLLCIISPAFIPGEGTSSVENDELLKGVNTRPQSTPAPAQNNTTAPMPGTQQPQQAPATTPATPAP